MTPRSIRRAAERKAAKAARKFSHATAPESAAEPAVEQAPAAPATLSEARLATDRAAINKRNAQFSTGPTTEEGKRKSSLNAVKTALTGQTVLLPSDDVARYQALIQSLIAQHTPATAAECRLVQSLADTQWRLNRIPALESALFSRGRVEFAEKFAEHEPALASALIDSETLIVYAKQLRNLHTQEGRLRRQYKQDLAALMALRAERIQSEQSEQSAPSVSAPSHPTSATGIGFEFTNRESSPVTPDGPHADVIITPDLHTPMAA